MSKYEALIALGIAHPENIARYSIFMVNNTDILRITYERKKGAILPASVNYRFPRLKKTTLVDSGTRRTEVVYESSREFRNAVAELDGLMDSKKSAVDLEELIKQEIHLLEEEVALRIAGIKSLVKGISSTDKK